MIAVTSAGRRRTAGFLLAFVLSLGVCVGLVGQQAQAAPIAAANPGVVGPVVTTVLEGAPVRGVAGAACATGGGCIAVGLVMLGLTLYSTRDMWLPFVQGFFNNGESEVRPDGSSGCPIVINSVSPLASGEVDVNYTYGATCGCGGSCGPPSMDLVFTQRQCIGTGHNPGRQLGEVYQPSTQGWYQRTQEGPDGGTGNTHQVTAFPGADISCQGLAEDAGAMFKALVQVTAERGASALVEVTWPIPDTFWKTDTEVGCKAPNGDVFTLAAGDVGDPDGALVPSCADAVEGALPTGITITQGGRPILTYDVDPDVETDYPNCFGPSGLLCTIRVTIDGLPCTPGMAGCVQWARHVRLNDSVAERLDCQFGPYSVPFVQCEPLKRAYVPQAEPEVITSTTVITEPDIETNPDPDPDPDPDPTTPPNPSSPPTTGPNPQTPPALPTPDTNPDSRSCLGATWSYNPVSWVYAPVKCALIWAFVPKTSLSARIDTIKGTITGKVPFSWFAGFGSIPGAIPGSSCPDWRIEIPASGFSENVVCDSSYTQAIRAARPVLLVFMGALALWPLIRSTAYAAFPIIKPQPGVLR